MYKITNSNGQTEILLYSLIEGGSTASYIIRQLKGAGNDPITLRINSDGGEVFESIALWNYLKNKDVNVIIDGICASGASIVAMAGKTITMNEGSMMMIHNPISLVYGDSEAFKNAAEVLDKITESVASVYESRTKLSHDEVIEMMKAETWMTAEEAVSLGFADNIGFRNTAPSPSAEEITDRYEEGVKAERARLHALDELNAPGREALLNEAKYIRCCSAQDIAIELLKAETHRPAYDITSLPVDVKAETEAEHIGAIVNRIRRMNHAG